MRHFIFLDAEGELDTLCGKYPADFPSETFETTQDTDEVDCPECLEWIRA